MSIGRRAFAGGAVVASLGGLRGTYEQLAQRLEEAERLVAQVAGGGPGCDHCAGWPANAVTTDDPTLDLPGPWPEPAVCPGCGRRPAFEIRIEYEEWTPTAGPLAEWRPGDTS